MKPLNAGDLRHRIAFQSPSDAPNEFGEQIPTWATFDTVWSKVEPISGKDLQLTRSLGGIETHKITCRYLSYIVSDGNTRIAFPPPGQFDGGAFSSAFACGGGGGGRRSRIFALTSVVNEEERNYSLVILATEDLKK